MFIGVNKIELNPATMHAAIEEYLKKRAVPTAAKFEVTAVQHRQGSNTFVVTVVEVEGDDQED